MLLRQLFHVVTHHGRAFVDADHIHCQQSTAEVEEFCGDAVVQQVGNLACGDAFGTYQFVDTQLTEHLAVFGIEQLGITDSGHRLLGLEFFGQDTGNEVYALIVQHRQEEVTVGHVGIDKYLRRGRITGNGH